MKYELTTFSPVVVGDGGILSIISDYFIENSKIHFINQPKIQEFFKSNLGLIDAYVKKTMSSIENNRSNINIKKDILQDLMNVKPYDYVSHSVPANGIKENSKIQIKTIIKTNGMPYIPGSSVKGTIKTFLLYSWLQDNNHILNTIIDRIGNLNLNDFNTLDRKLKERWSNEFSKQIEALVQPGLSSVNFDKFLVSDTNSISKEKINIYSLNRIHLNKPQSDKDIPIISEAISPNTVFSVDIDFNIGNLDLFNKSIFDNFYNYTLDLIQFDSDEIENSNLDKKIQVEYIYNNEVLLDELEKSSSIFLRIGYGKTYFYNSIGLAIYKKDKNVFKKFKEILMLQGKKNLDTFPVTRLVIQNNYNQLGWIKISQIKKGK